MATVQDIMARAQSLRQETALNSITPERAGGIMYDTAALFNQQQLLGISPLVISKTYGSAEDMAADANPVSDLTGEPLRPGQIVVISSGQPDEPGEGLVYRYDGTDQGESSWTVVGQIGSDPYLEGFQFMGKAVLTPTPTDPGVPTQKVFYQATEPGTYTNFGGIVVAAGEVVNLKWDGTAWSKEVTGAATNDRLNYSEAELYKSIYAPEDLAILTPQDGTITATGAWSANNKHLILPITGIRKVVYALASSSLSNSILAFLKTYDPSQAFADFSDAFPARITVSPGEVKNYDVPADANYLYIVNKTTGVNDMRENESLVFVSAVEKSAEEIAASANEVDIPRGIFVKRNTTISHNLQAIPPYVKYSPSDSVDAVLVAIPDGATRIVPTGGVASRFRFFDTYGKVDAESYIDAQDTTTGAIPDGAKFAVVLFPHADNPGGLGNLLLTIEPTAEQVAEGLENVVGGRDVPFDLSPADELGFIIQTSGTWGSTAGKLSSGFAIPIPKFATGITITGSANGNSVVALLANNAVAAGETPNYAANHQGRIVISGGETIRRNLESDCKYLYFSGTTNAGADIKPTVSCSFAIPGAGRRSIRLLFIGSSGEQDIVGYVPPILSSVLPDYDIIVGDMYTSGSQADEYVSYYQADTPCEKFNYWTPNAPYWSRLDNMTIEDVLALQKWDFVVFKGDVTDCRQLMRIIQSVATYPVSFVTDARYSRNYDGDWAAVIEEVDEMMNGAGFSGWFPCGTALENARSNSAMRVAGTNTLTERTEFTIPAGRSLAFFHRIRQITGNPSTITAQRISGDGAIDIYASAAIMGTDNLLLSLTDGSEHAATFAGGTDYVRITNNGNQAAVVSLEDSNSLGNFFLYQDNQHLQSGLGTLIVGYAVALRVLEWTGNKHRGLNGSRFAPTDAVLATILPQGGALGHGPSCGIVDYIGSDGNVYDRAQLVNIGGTLYVYTTVFDNTPDANSITAVAGDINWGNIFAAQEIAYFSANRPSELTDCAAVRIAIPQKN